MTKKEKDIVHKIAPKIKKQMMESGDLMISYQPFDELPIFFRIVFINPGITNIDNILTWFVDNNVLFSQ